MKNQHKLSLLAKALLCIRMPYENQFPEIFRDLNATIKLNLAQSPIIHH